MKKYIQSLITTGFILMMVSACGNEDHTEDMMNDETSASMNTDVVSDSESNEQKDSGNKSDKEQRDIPEGGKEQEEETTPEDSGKQEKDTTPQDSKEEEVTYQDYIDMPIMYPDGTMGAISDYEGKFILLNFFGEWCKYCKLEMPDLDAFYRNYEGDDFVILVMDVLPLEKNYDADYERVYEWYQEQGYSMPIVFDTDGQIAATYSVNSYPTSYFINKEGKVLGAIQGAIDGDFIQQVLDTYMNE